MGDRVRAFLATRPKPAAVRKEQAPLAVPYFPGRRLIFGQSHAAGIRHYFLEHDEPKDPLAFARSGYAYLKRLRF